MCMSFYISKRSTLLIFALLLFSLAFSFSLRANSAFSLSSKILEAFLLPLTWVSQTAFLWLVLWLYQHSKTTTFIRWYWDLRLFHKSSLLTLCLQVSIDPLLTPSGESTSQISLFCIGVAGSLWIIASAAANLSCCIHSMDNPEVEIPTPWKAFTMASLLVHFDQILPRTYIKTSLLIWLSPKKLSHSSLHTEWKEA